MMTARSRFLLLAAAVAASCLLAQSAWALAFTTPTGWTRGDPNSTYQHWDVFTTDTGALPDVANDNPNGTATLSETGPGFVSGSQNIYSFSGDLVFEIDVPDFDIAGNVTTVLLQTATEGSELIPGTIFANGVAPYYTEELFRGLVSSPFGDVFRVETLFAFEVPTTALVGIDFQSAVHTSFAEAAVDTYSMVPEPATAALMLAGLTGLALQRGPRRRLAP